MNKSIAVALGLLFALTVAGVAWAAWQANLVVGVTVTARESYDVSIIGAQAIGSGADKVQVSVSQDKLVLDIGVMKADPSEQFEVTFKFKNSGSGPIKITRENWWVGKVEPPSEYLTIGLVPQVIQDIAAGAESPLITVTVTMTDAIEAGETYGPYELRWTATPAD